MVTFRGTDENVDTSYLYRAFGEQTDVITEGISNRFTWVGRLGYYRQPDLGNYWLRARLYDPNRGRFVSRDPMPNGNLYIYPGNSPVLLVDPSGMQVRGRGCLPGETCFPIETRVPAAAGPDRGGRGMSPLDTSRDFNDDDMVTIAEAKATGAGRQVTGPLVPPGGPGLGDMPGQGQPPGYTPSPQAGSSGPLLGIGRLLPEHTAPCWKSVGTPGKEHVTIISRDYPGPVPRRCWDWSVRTQNRFPCCKWDNWPVFLDAQVKKCQECWAKCEKEKDLPPNATPADAAHTGVGIVGFGNCVRWCFHDDPRGPVKSSIRPRDKYQAAVRRCRIERAPHWE